MKKILGVLMLAMAACGPIVVHPPPAPPGPSVTKLGLVGSYHGPLDAATLAHMAAWRSDLTLRAAISSADQARQILAAVAPYPSIHILWLIEGVNDELLVDLSPLISAADRPNPTVGIELGNELDLAGLTAAQFHDWVQRSWSGLRANGFTKDIISGGIYTTQPAALAWLTAAAAGWPADVVLGMHRYGDPDRPVEGYRTRLDETTAIQATAGRHAWAITEFGYPTRTPDGEAWAVGAVRKDLAWFTGATYALLYQYTDGSGDGDIDHFGVRAVDGRWKPLEQMFSGVPPAPPPVARLSFDVVACRTPFVDNYCDGPAGAVFKLHTGINPDTYLTIAGDGNGYAFVQDFPNVPDSDITITAPNYATYAAHISPPILAATNAKGIHNVWELTPAHVDPSSIPLEQLAAIHGAMWPQTQGACGNLSIGPRPGADTNIFATVFLSEYPKAEADCMLRELHDGRGYTHAVAGPLVDSDGYHGVWTPNDWRTKWDAFLDLLQTLWDAHLTPVVFIHPDGWTFEQTRDQLTPLLQQPRAQKLIRIAVPHGWEPCRYECSSYTWAAYGKWMRETLPNALVLLHTVADVDGPVGTDGMGDDNGHPNAEGWQRVAPYFHGWLTQSSAFADPDGHGDPGHPGNSNFQNWQDNFRCAIAYSYCNRFHNGYAGWPTSSAWSSGPLRVFAGEYSAYWRFWGGRSEAEGVKWGDAAMAAGADGFMDGGSVAVPVH